MRKFIAAAAALMMSVTLLGGKAMPVSAAEDLAYQYQLDLSKGPITLKGYQLHSPALSYHGFIDNPAVDNGAESDAEAFLQYYFFDRSNGTVIGGDNKTWEDDRHVVYAIIPNGTDKVVYVEMTQTDYQKAGDTSAAFVDMTLQSGDQSGAFGSAVVTQMFDIGSKSFYNVNRLFTVTLGSAAQ